MRINTYACITTNVASGSISTDIQSFRAHTYAHKLRSAMTKRMRSAWQRKLAVPARCLCWCATAVLPILKIAHNCNAIKMQSHIHTNCNGRRVVHSGGAVEQLQRKCSALSPRKQPGKECAVAFELRKKY